MAKISHDDIDKYFEYGLDIPNRTIYLGCANYNEDGDGNGVDFHMTEKFIKALHILDMQAPQGDKPITIIANNPGGSWYHGMAMFGAMESCKNHVTIKMYGHAMSMGSVIPQAADERLIDKRCRFMIHYGYDGGHGHSKLFEKWSDEGKIVNYEMENIYLDKMIEKDEEMQNQGVYDYLETVMSQLMDRQNIFKHPPAPKTKYKFSKVPAKRKEDIRAALRDFLNFDSFLTAEETVALGLADDVI